MSALSARVLSRRPERRTILRSLRTVASSALAGAVTAGVLFGWAGVGSLHEIGAVVGAGLGGLAYAKHFI